jgi:heat shock protein HslJ
MKKIAITYSLILFLVISCDKKEKNVNSNEIVPDTTAVVVFDEHNAKNSLDYLGMYQGIVPCADCEGIETTLFLANESSYVLKTKYLGKKDIKINEQKGTYTWNEAGNSIILAGIENGPAKYFVGENYVVQLDMEGNKIEGDLAEKYILQKQTVSEDAPPPAPSQTISNQYKSSKEVVYTIKDTKWKLVELNGKAIENKNKSSKMPFLQLNADDRYAAYAGCNNMMGGYELKENVLRIKFTKGASTMMACPDMETEQEFAKMLETVDNYSIKGNQMIFTEALRKAPIARFEAIK